MRILFMQESPFALTLCRTWNRVSLSQTRGGTCHDSQPSDSALLLTVFIGLSKGDESDDAVAKAQTIVAMQRQPIEVASSNEAAARAKIIQALDEETKFEFNELPLQDVILYLKDRHHIEFQLATKVLEEASIGVETPVTRSLQGLSLRSALQLMLGAMDLTYLIKDEVVLITTPEAANRETSVRIYQVGDLISPDATGKPEEKFAGLIEVIKGTLGPDSWQGSGGKGSIQPWAPGQSLVIRQTSARHDEIEPLLAGFAPVADH